MATYENGWEADKYEWCIGERIVKNFKVPCISLTGNPWESMRGIKIDVPDGFSVVCAGYSNYEDKIVHVRAYRTSKTEPSDTPIEVKI